MAKHLQKTLYVTPDTLRQIAIISKDLGEINESAAIRYCIKQVYDSLKLSQRKEGRA